MYYNVLSLKNNYKATNDNQFISPSCCMMEHIMT